MSTANAPRMFSLTYAPTRHDPEGNLAPYPRDVDDAAGFGWNARDEGYSLLMALEVGSSVQDDDGDTWTRLQ